MQPRVLPRRSTPWARVLPLLLAACDGGTDPCDQAGTLCGHRRLNPPSLAVSDASVLEGSGGVTEMVFTVALSRATDSTVTVDYETLDATASTPLDYEGISGTVFFPPRAMEREIRVRVESDVYDDGADESFWLILSSPSNASLRDAIGMGTIVDDDVCGLQPSVGRGQTRAGSLDPTDCVSATGQLMEMRLLTVDATRQTVIDQISAEIDSYLAVWSLDGTPLAEEDGGSFASNARIVATLAVGSYLVVSTSATAGEEGSYDVSVDRRLFGATASRNAESELYTIDLATGIATRVGPIGFSHVGAIDVHPSTGVLYGLGERSAADSTKVLVSIDPATGLGTEVGPLGVVSRFRFAGVSFREDGALFAYHAESVAHALYRIDVTTGAATLIGPTGLSFSGGNGIVFDAEGALYHSNQIQTSSIDPASGEASEVAAWAPPPGCAAGRVSGADQPSGGRTIFGVVKCGSGNSSTELLAVVDYAAGTATVIGSTVEDLDGLAAP